MENWSRSECFLTASLHRFAAPSSFLTFKASLLPICTTSLQSSPSLIMPWFITTLLSTVFLESAVVFLLFHFNPLCGLPKPLRSSLLLVLYCDNDIIGKAFSPSSLLLSVNGVNVILCPRQSKNVSWQNIFLDLRNFWTKERFFRLLSTFVKFICGFRN